MTSDDNCGYSVERRELESDADGRETVLRKMYHVIADKDREFEEKVERLLELGRETLDTEYGALSYVDGDNYIFEIVHDPEGQTQPGDVVPLGETNCERAIDTEQTLVLSDIEAEAPELTDRTGFTDQGIECYIGTPVVVEGETYGTFCFYDRTARTESFSEWEVTLVELMGKWVSYEQERKNQADELARQREVLEDFAKVVAHDLRNPLNIAAVQLELARGQLEDDDVTKNLEEVSTALSRMEQIIGDVLTLANIGQQDIDRTRLHLKTVADSAWDTVESDDASLKVGENLRPIVGDHGLLQQLFENLFRNSFDYAGTTPTVRIGMLDSGFYVEDDGPGIPKDERESVFEGGYSIGEGSTGFGLSIVEEIAGAHGWDVKIVDGNEGGARFEVEGVQVA
ncbi:GAF domain-containing sensor histidine kinase [Halorussus halophilus]|uniref:GAF domain-containing sensor histidine kinase n=1 Tax=Halorussus halophilus TaxID=2650975 RepID=UPI00130157C8|nr:GAF domain-containing sensor histidine kinase [Halorussus halophilus]